MIAALALAAAQAMTFTADRIAADKDTRTLVATGHLFAVSGPLTLRGDLMTRDPDGVMLFKDPVCATTCTNEVGHTHWNVTGEVEFREDDYVILRNAWVYMYEIPVFWFPYLYYPLDATDCGFSWMPGYTGRWGGFLLTKYTYHLLGDKERGENTWWLDGDTRFDLRYRQGVAFGEDLSWNLGDFGKGRFNMYYAWDNDADRYDTSSAATKYIDYGNDVDRNRYIFGLTHRWEPTERDTVRLQGAFYSDPYVTSDFYRKTMLGWDDRSIGYRTSGVFWEHLENDLSVGAEVSGRLNKFYGMTGRLPEVYFDLNPQPLWSLPVNYETQNRLGYLTRDPAEFGGNIYANPYAVSPGLWADYDAFRFDTYHRLTAPFKTCDDVLGVVPRIGYHGTTWSSSGKSALSGYERAGGEGYLYRSILEGGVTFAGRGTAWVNQTWQHMVEPYFDVLAQQAWYGGSGDRPYVFDSIDASVMWEDQFAGRSRNLPYTYYGVTPGVRNAWSKADEHGTLRQIVDFDIYAALQCNRADMEKSGTLADRGSPNYGADNCVVAPGARLRWTPNDSLTLRARAEYDSDNNSIPVADAGLQQKLSDEWKFDLTYMLRDHRVWDYGFSTYDSSIMSNDAFNYAKYQFLNVGFENHPIDWFAWGPFVRWDIRYGDLDRIGSWFDYLTDCLGFRLIVEYQNAYTMVSGYERDEDWSVGFYIYLRAFGADSANLFMQ